MQSMLERLNQLDVDAKAQSLLNFVDKVDPCFLGLIVTALVLLGSRMIGGQRSIRAWGLRLAAATFLLYFGYKCYVAGVSGYSKRMLDVALRSACISGGVLAFTWIVVPIASFVLRHLRVALAAFLAYGTYLLTTKSQLIESQWPFLLLQAALASALALLVAWITEPFWTYFAKNWLPQRRPIRGATLIVEEESPQPPAEFVRPVAVEPRPRRRSTMLASPREILGDSAEADLETLRARDAQRRREKARLQAELAYVQAMPAIGTWFPRPTFDDFLRRYLNDALPPEDVEENARQLMETLQQQQDQADAPMELSSMEELTGWLLTEQQRIQGTARDPSLKNSQLLDLHQRYLALAARFLHPQQPALSR